MYKLRHLHQLNTFQELIPKSVQMVVVEFMCRYGGRFPMKYTKATNTFSYYDLGKWIIFRNSDIDLFVRYYNTHGHMMTTSWLDYLNNGFIIE